MYNKYDFFFLGKNLRISVIPQSCSKGELIISYSGWKLVSLAVISPQGWICVMMPKLI
jgi:hypothetical protein